MRVGNLRIRLDSGRAIAFNIRENPHLDYGYAVTSHSSQGQTADRVLIHVDTEQGGEKLVNRRLAYVAVSRGRYDAQIYTNDKTALAEGLGRDVSHRSALESTRAAEPRVAQKSEPASFSDSGEGANNRTRPQPWPLGVPPKPTVPLGLFVLLYSFSSAAMTDSIFVPYLFSRRTRRRCGRERRSSYRKTSS